MARYNRKSKSDLVYDANRKRIRAEGAILLAELMNEALTVMTEQFEIAEQEGEVLELDGNKEQLKAYLWEASKRELGPKRKTGALSK